MADQKLNAQQRVALTLGVNIVEVETLRDQVEALQVQIAERDATIAKLLEAMRPEAVGAE